MDIFRSIVFFFIAIVVLVGFHEFGHFIVARLCGVKVLRFSLGFGKIIYSHTGKDGCEYALSLIPLGGYVKMLDRREMEVPEDQLDQEFSSQKVWKRLAIVAAGPLFNIVLAFFLYWGMYMIGVAAIKPYVTGITENSVAWNGGLRNDDMILKVGDHEVLDWEDATYELIQQIGNDDVTLTVNTAMGRQAQRTLSIKGWSIHRDQVGHIFKDLGFMPKYYNPTRRIGGIAPDSPAQKAGLKEGDEILGIDNHKVDDWFQFSDYVSKRPGQKVQIQVARPILPDNLKTPLSIEEYEQYHYEVKAFELTLDTVEDKNEKRGRVGVSMMAYPLDEGIRFVRKYDPVDAVGKSISKMIAVCRLTVVTLGKLINGSIPVDNISGPIAIAKSAGITASIGLEYFLGFMAIISINLGIMNLIPLPVLDGGHIMFYSIEAIVGKPLPDKVMQWLMYFGIFVLLLIMIVAVYNDIVFDGF